ncbi:MAG: PocR ligand-binding domain-containing protein [Spirochaetes bacterium]|nr:PocR ligand-binding domain-containing protein [Spirochaetota bacterium]
MPKKRSTTAGNLFQELLETITALTGVSTVIYDRARFTVRAGRRQIDWTFDGHRSAFCTLARSTPAGRCACIASDVDEAVADALTRGEPYLHTCHAGLIEAVVPVMYRGEHIATVFCGQSQVNGAPASQKRWLYRRAKAFGIDPSALYAAYHSLNMTDTDKLLRIGKLLSLALTQLAETEDRAAFNRTLALTRNPAVREIAAYADAHFREQVSIGRLAKRVRHSTAYLSRLFHRSMGKTFSDYLAERRIGWAKHLLVTTGLSVADIAENVGYLRQSYFARKFKALTGLTPLEYRRKYRRTK